ncbi:hypothetical protein [Clostridium cellulovorans]|uniref:hypothetical protein n=1 Tax=Clostridium cellulovorans TaxID=1493 RepID=UPI0001A96AD5|nr:hypothetical protein [Clostridium cellulovorans]
MELCDYLDIKLTTSDLLYEIKGFFQRTKHGYEIEADKFTAELLIGDNINDIDFSELNVEQICSSLCALVKLMKYKFNLNI